MGILGSIFTWWNGATIGTSLALRGKKAMGEDALGNRYFMGGKDTAGNPRRWVIYNGANDASRVPPEHTRSLVGGTAQMGAACGSQCDRHRARLSTARCTRTGRQAGARNR